MEWAIVLQSIQGRRLKVETEYLFKDQFNTAPIKGVSKYGLRIMKESVEKVYNDERIGKGRCNWCGKTVFMSDVKYDACPECKSIGYIEDFEIS
jgi:predicted Zn-ribbon and HTH transcriptional regulator